MRKKEIHGSPLTIGTYPEEDMGDITLPPRRFQGGEKRIEMSWDQRDKIVDPALTLLIQ